MERNGDKIKMKNEYKGYITIDKRIKDLKRGSIERELLIEFSLNEYRDRLKGELPKAHFYVNQKHLGGELGVTPMTISRALKKMIGNGFITEIDKSRTKGVPSIYRLENVYHQMQMINQTDVSLIDRDNLRSTKVLLFPKVDKKDKNEID